jgi:hypothetical protein
MLDYEEYGSSFRQPRALRDDGGPANNEFQRYDGNQVNTEGRPATATPDDELNKKKPGAPSVGAAVAAAPQPQTFAQMQAAGIARPPAPLVNQQMNPTGMSVQPFQTTAPVLQGEPASGTTMEDKLRSSWEGYTPQDFGTGKDTEMQQRIRDAIMQSIGSPSRYDTDVAKRSFDQLSGDIDDDYNARDQTLRESIASRGLGAIGDGTIGTSDQRFQNLQRRSAKQRMATDILREQANTYGSDRSTAIRDAMGYGNDQFGNDLAEADFNARRKQEAYNNYTGYGQQAFENQTTAAEMKNRQQQQNYEMLMKLLGIS